MSYYELMVIFSPALSDEDEKAQTSQVEELIRHEKGNIHLMDHWGKRKLAYNIKKQRQGYYEWFYFELEPGRIAEIERKLKMSETILRFLAFKMEKIQIQNLHREIARRTESAQPVAAPEPVPAAEPVAEEPAEPTETSAVTATAADPAQES